jgi:hypothetical protein
MKANGRPWAPPGFLDPGSSATIIGSNYWHKNQCSLGFKHIPVLKTDVSAEVWPKGDIPDFALILRIRGAQV